MNQHITFVRNTCHNLNFFIFNLPSQCFKGWVSVKYCPHIQINGFTLSIFCMTFKNVARLFDWLLVSRVCMYLTDITENTGLQKCNQFLSPWNIWTQTLCIGLKSQMTQTTVTRLHREQANLTATALILNLLLLDVAVQSLLAVLILTDIANFHSSSALLKLKCMSWYSLRN